ncbi:MAG TPA: hypothetical protein PKW35_06400 [Nannocystaceae bacterium]|nr:hypothetical protein [Nannocystaceae bacterium]
MVASALLLVLLAALPLFAEIGNPSCVFGNGARCGEGPPVEPWAVLLLLAPWVPLLLSIHRDLRVP